MRLSGLSPVPTPLLVAESDTDSRSLSERHGRSRLAERPTLSVIPPQTHLHRYLAVALELN